MTHPPTLQRLPAGEIHQGPLDQGVREAYLLCMPSRGSIAAVALCLLLPAGTVLGAPPAGHGRERAPVAARVLEDLVTDEINSLRDQTPWDDLVAKEERHKALLTQVSARWDDVIAFLGEDEEEDFIDE